MQTAELVAGRELDARIAEKVMGIDLRVVTPADIGRAVMAGMNSNRPNDTYSVMTFDWGDKGDIELSYQGSKFNYGGANGNDGYGLWFWEQREGKDWQPLIEAHVANWRRSVPEYSTDISAAFQALNGWSVTLSHAESLDWHCHVMRPDRTTGGWVLGDGDAATAPLAICKALLAAVNNI